MISVIGTGYVGLVSGTCFAEMGFKVTCIDINKKKIADLKRGIIPIYEPGLEDLVKKNVKEKRLNFTSSLEEGVKGKKIIFIAVGTPTHPETGLADLKYIMAVAEELATKLKDNSLIVIKSTVPVGTGKKVKELIEKKNPKLIFHMVSNPEFLREGNAIQDFMHPDRIVVGASSEKAITDMRRLYQLMIDKEVPVLFTDVQTAELTKYASNAFLATKIAFVNEMADLCEKSGANIDDVSMGMGLDPRIGKDYLKPGPGYGGSCFPKDTLALLKTSEIYKRPTKIVEAVIHSNDRRKVNMAKKIIKACGGNVKGKTIAVLGLAFKANTDDVRESSALVIVEELLKAGAIIQAHDPEAMHEAEKLIKGKVSYEVNSYEALAKADAAVVITEWEEFKNIELPKARQIMKKPVVVDLRNIFSRKEMKALGFDYYSLGKRAVIQEKIKKLKYSKRV